MFLDTFWRVEHSRVLTSRTYAMIFLTLFSTRSVSGGGSNGWFYVEKFRALAVVHDIAPATTCTLTKRKERYNEVSGRTSRLSVSLLYSHSYVWCNLRTQLSHALHLHFCYWRAPSLISIWCVDTRSCPAVSVCLCSGQSRREFSGRFIDIKWADMIQYIWKEMW
jgi:hypothetical protein